MPVALDVENDLRRRSGHEPGEQERDRLVDALDERGLGVEATQLTRDAPREQEVEERAVEHTALPGRARKRSSPWATRRAPPRGPVARRPPRRHPISAVCAPASGSRKRSRDTKRTRGFTGPPRGRGPPSGRPSEQLRPAGGAPARRLPRSPGRVRQAIRDLHRGSAARPAAACRTPARRRTPAGTPPRPRYTTLSAVFPTLGSAGRRLRRRGLRTRS